MKSVSLREIEYIALQYDKNNKVSENNEKYARSCLDIPFLKRDSALIHKSYIERAAILFYQLLKNQPFKKCNDKIAMAALFYYLSKHNRWLDADTTALYNFIQWVKMSLTEVKDGTIKAITDFLERYIVKFPK